MTLVNIVRPGDGVDPAAAEQLRRSARRRPPRRARPASSFLVQLVPSNVVQAMADGDMLAVMVFALFLGVGLAAVRTERGAAPSRRPCRGSTTS